MFKINPREKVPPLDNIVYKDSLICKKKSLNKINIDASPHRFSKGST